MRIRGLFLIAAMSAALLLVAGCGADQPSPGAVATTGGKTASADPGVPADLRYVCDHVSDAFRDGGLGDADQFGAQATELQGMIDVADHEAVLALTPLKDAADAIALDGRDEAKPKLSDAYNKAVDQLKRICVAAGSKAWP